MTTHHKHHYHYRDYIKILTLRTLGNFLILGSLFIIGKTFYQPVYEEVHFFIDKYNGKKYVVVENKQEEVEIERSYSGDGQKGLLSQLKAREVEFLTPKDANFGIVIPKIAANASIVSNVDSADRDQYLEKLKIGVAHASGTAFPGEGGHIYLFAHSTDYFWNVGTYNAVFYLLYKLANGDEIDLFYQGNRYVYSVIDSKVVDPDQVQYLLRKTSSEFVTLQTCWPPGTALKRLLIFAKRVVE